MLICGSLLGLAAGFIMHRADFCLAGMFRDLFLFGAVFKLRILLVLIISSMVLFETARLAGMVTLYPFPLFGSPSLTAPLGGLIFGIGMVLAGGCVVGSLYKTGSGSIPSLVAVIGMVVGSAFFAEIFPWWRSITAAATILTGEVTLAEAFDIAPYLPITVVLIITTPLIMSWYRQGYLLRPTYTEGALQPLTAALLLSLIGLLSVIAIGMPLGITTSYAKAAAVSEATLFPEHYAGVKFFQTTPLTYQQPITGELLHGGPGNGFDGIALIQYPLIFGIIAGSALSAVLLGEFHFRWKAPLRQYLSVAIGGVFMGVASRMAAGCNVWHLLGGVPILSIQSTLFVCGLFPGAWLGTKILTHFIIR